MWGLIAACHHTVRAPIRIRPVSEVMALLDIKRRRPRLSNSLWNLKRLPFIVLNNLFLALTTQKFIGRVSFERCLVQFSIALILIRRHLFIIDITVPLHHKDNGTYGSTEHAVMIAQTGRAKPDGLLWY